MSRDFRIYLVTWNVAERDPPEDLTELLGLDKELPNLYAIGLQEMRSNTSSLLTDAVHDDPWTNALTDILVKKNYVRIKTVRMMGVHLAVFVKKDNLNFLTNIESEITKSGFGGLWGNKGGVSVRMDICGVNVCFVNCHLAAHLEGVAKRIEDYDQIVENQGFRDPDVDYILDHDYVFWMGDMNFRLDDVPNDEVKARIVKQDISYLHQFDQLKKLMANDLVFVDFEEGKINFPPTYKFDPGTDIYDTSKKQRKPAWCDRILWMVHEDAFEGLDLDVKQTSYECHPQYKMSDHRPVTADFIVKVLKKPPELPVMFEPLDTWDPTDDVKVSYTIPTSLPVSGWDWVALYHVDFKHPRDYVMYEWASTSGEDMRDKTNMYQVKFDSKKLMNLEGTYFLGYYNKDKNCVTGYSNQFKISAEDSSGEESTLEDTEDTSTLRQRKTAN